RQLAPELQLLVVRVRSYRDHQASARRELLQQRPRDLLRRRGDQDGVEWRRLRPPFRAVRHPELDVLISELPERPLCPPGELRNDLDGADGGSQRKQLAEDRRLVAAASADLEHALAPLEVKRFGHRSDDVWLRDRLAIADLER